MQKPRVQCYELQGFWYFYYNKIAYRIDPKYPPQDWKDISWYDSVPWIGF
jgi:hypothetical protein